MTVRKDGGPAFPGGAVVMHADGYARTSPPKDGGMSLRAWLTGQALAGLTANASLLEHLRESDDISDRAFALSVAAGAVAMADAALELLTKDQI